MTTATAAATSTTTSFTTMASEALNTADAAAGSIKRKAEDGAIDQTELKKIMTSMPGVAPPPTTTMTPEEEETITPKVREVRLEQNRKAARESRKRKKVMIEELQRSVIFFSRANGTLKQQNDELTRLLMQAQAQAKAAEATPAATAPPVAPVAAPPTAVPAPHVAATVAPAAPPAQAAAAAPPPTQQEQQAHAQAVATQAIYESQGFPAAAARAAAQTMNTLPPMQPGATMQAMANFQQAAAAAMQAAMQGMQGIPGVNMTQMTAAPAGANAQQAYTDTMTALAMQQAAAAHMGHQFMSSVFNPMVAWPQPAAAAVATAASVAAPVAAPVVVAATPATPVAPKVAVTEQQISDA